MSLPLGPEDLVPAALAWQAGKAVAPKVFGPTADYIGTRVLDSVKAAENATKVAMKAMAKLGSRSDEPGSLPPRVTKEFIEEAPFAEDAFIAEYLSGVLASSRSPLGRDDTGAALMAQVGRLSSYALRAHFLLHCTMRDLLVEAEEYRIGTHQVLTATFVPWHEYVTAMELADEGPADRVRQLGLGALHELAREGLIHEPDYGDRDRLRIDYLGTPSDGLIIPPTRTGFNLWMAALGFPPEQFERWVESDLRLPELEMPYEGIRNSFRVVTLPTSYQPDAPAADGDEDLPGRTPTPDTPGTDTASAKGSSPAT